MKVKVGCCEEVTVDDSLYLAALEGRDIKDGSIVIPHGSIGFIEVSKASPGGAAVVGTAVVGTDVVG